MSLMSQEAASLKPFLDLDLWILMQKKPNKKDKTNQINNYAKFAKRM